jgi:hypothetical protein
MPCMFELPYSDAGFMIWLFISVGVLFCLLLLALTESFSSTCLVSAFLLFGMSSTNMGFRANRMPCNV